MEIKLPRLKSQTIQHKLFIDYWQELHDAHKSGKKVAWVSGMSPSELLAAMDFLIVYPMNHAATCGAAGVATGLCEASEQNGYSPDLCGYQRCDIGSALLGNQTTSPVRPPQPDLLLVTSNQQCHQIIKWFENISRIYDVPLLMVDVPFLDDTATREDELSAVKYVKEQLQEFISFIEGFTKRRYNYDRLQECMANASAAYDLWYEGLFNAAKNIPSPISTFDLFIHLGPMLYLRSRPEAVTYYRNLKDEVAERVTQRQGAVPYEKYRLFMNGMNWMKIPSLSRLFASYNACLVTGIYPLLFTLSGGDVSRPVETMAKSSIQSLLNRGLQTRIDAVQNLVSDFSIDGIIAPTIRGCKPISSFQLETMREVERLTGIPSLEFETCMVDTRYHSDAQIEVRIQAFMELLENRAQKAK
jgi:benzoyl-CoA reductase/2-hydroxyglutaryl-CoA dehydratase subunit BcrC/BadD/HgdB